METQYSITECGKTKLLTTNSGIFHIPNNLFEHYFNSARISKDDFPHRFGKVLARATIPESIDARLKNESWYNEELDEEVRRFVLNEGINPKDYLDEKNYFGNDKTTSLWDSITPNILNIEARNQLFYRFSSTPGSRTFLEHLSEAGSSKFFFGNPFTGGYSPDKDILQDIRIRRKREVLENPTSLGFILLLNRKNYAIKGWATVGNIRELYYSGNWIEKQDQSLAREVLNKIYLTSRKEDSPEDFHAIDYVRVLMKPVQYDGNMVAVPKPTSLEFLANQNVVARNTDKSILSCLKPRKSDYKLADTVKDKNGEIHYVGMYTRNGEHFLKEISKTSSWFESYYNRVMEELPKSKLV